MFLLETGFVHIVSEIPLHQLDERTRILAAAIAKVKCADTVQNCDTVDAIIARRPKVQVLLISSKILMDPSHITSLRWVTQKMHHFDCFFKHYTGTCNCILTLSVRTLRRMQNESVQVQARSSTECSPKTLKRIVNYLRSTLFLECSYRRIRNLHWLSCSDQYV